MRGLELPQPGLGEIEVDMEYSGISTGTERLLWDGTMPAFPGMGYPLIPGYESVGRICRTGPESTLRVGQRVFVPGAQCFQGVRSLFGGSASRLVVAESRTAVVDDAMGAEAVLLALAATAYHAVAGGGKRSSINPPDLIVGHGVMGRLLARMTVAAGGAAPTVWELDPTRHASDRGYAVVHPDQDDRKDYRAIYDVSGDATILDRLISRLAPGGEVVLAGFYSQALQFSYAPAFMREAQIRVAAEWKKPDLLAVTELVQSGRLALDGLITHAHPPHKAHQAYEVAFGDKQCLKMILDWSASA